MNHPFSTAAWRYRIMVVGGEVPHWIEWCEANAKGRFSVRPVLDAPAPGIAVFSFASPEDATVFMVSCWDNPVQLP